MTDWQEWHSAYDDPESSLSRRLAVVRHELARLLDERRGQPTQLVSLCAGDGRDTLPVLADGRSEVDAVLVELDPDLATAARTSAAERRLPRVEVRMADAGTVDALADVPPADVFLACGVFGNIRDEDVERTVASLPRLLASDAAVIWTRGRRVDPDPTRSDGDPAEWIRTVFTDAGFEEEAFIRPTDAGFRVGVHRFVDTPGPRPAPGTRIFTFVR